MGVNSTIGDPNLTPAQPPLERELVDRTVWFVRLRWFAGGAALIGPAVARWGLGIPIGSSASLVGLGVLLYNLAFCRMVRRIQGRGCAAPHLAILINLQIVLDLVSLTWLVCLTGGVRSPLRWFFVFHAILTPMLLRRRDAYLHAAIATGLMACVAFFDRAGWLTVPSGLAWEGESQRPFWGLGFFATTQFIAVFLSDSISGSLRAKKEQIAAIQRDLSEAYRQLEELDSNRSRFVLTVTHELRSPVAAIDSLLNAIAFAGELPAKAKDLVGRANQRVHALLHLVNDLLEVAKERHEFGAGEFRPVDLGEVLRTVCTTHQSQAEEKRILLQFQEAETGGSAIGDPEGLDRLFSNLVGNALNYTGPGGQVSVRLSVDREPSPPEAVIVVKDTGIGIPAESLRRLFQEFYRAPNAKKMVAHGTGLGLTICKRIVEEHRGRIGVESQENVGTTFTVRMPAAIGHRKGYVREEGHAAIGSPQPA